MDSDALRDRLAKLLAPDYSLGRLLGSGGMGAVYLAYEPALDRRVAVKILHPEMATAEMERRFVAEAQTIAKLAPHPHIVSIHTTRQGEGLSCYIMDYLPGGTLANQLQNGTFTPKETSRLGQGLLNGLAAVHRIGVVHRDIKPSNIFVVDGRAMIGDFGIAHTPRNEPESDLTAPGQQIGTVIYMSPEQSSGQPVEGRSDLYSAALVMYEALTGRRWPMHTSPKLGNWTGVPPRLAAVLKRALQPAPGDRWPNATDFEAALASLEKARTPILPVFLALVLGVLGTIVWSRHPTSICRQPGRSDLALLPFTVSGGSPGVGGDDFARMVQLELDWFGRLRVTPEASVACWIDSVPPLLRDVRARQDLRAGQVVSGLLLRQPAGWVLRMTVRDREPEPSHVLTVAGDSTDPIGWSRAAADSIVRQVFPQHWAYYYELRKRANPNSNREAYAQYFAGERDFQRDAYHSARQHYEAALAADPTFLYASWRLGIVYRFLRLPFAEHLRNLYDEHAEELPDQYRALIQGLLDPDLLRRFQLYRATVADFPQDGYVRFVYADELFHRGPLVGYPIDSALAQFRAAVAIEPDLEQMPAFDHLFYGYLHLGRRPQADSALKYRVSIPPSGEQEDAQRRKFFRFAYDARFHSWKEPWEGWWVSLDVDPATLDRINRYARLGFSFDVPNAQRTLGRILVEKGLDRDTRANGHRAEGLALMFLGRPLEALPHLDTATVMWNRPDALLERAEWRVMPGTYGLPGIPQVQRDSALFWLRTIAGDRSATGTRALWALAVDAQSRGDTAAALTYSSRMTAAGAARLRSLVDAMQRAARGRAVDALRLSDALISYDTAGVVQDPFARSVLYLQRIKWQLSLGDSAAADATRLWFHNSDSGIEGWPQRDLEAGDIDGMLAVFGRLLQAESDRAAGRTSSACDLARRVRELWSDAEPSFSDLQQRAGRAAEICSR
ncbi:MAG TPA: protein kinase [Gemmatimonadales bacterium]